MACRCCADLGYREGKGDDKPFGGGLLLCSARRVALGSQLSRECTGDNELGQPLITDPQPRLSC